MITYVCWLAAATTSPIQKLPPSITRESSSAQSVSFINPHFISHTNNMADKSPNFSFMPLDAKKFNSLENKETQQLLLKWYVLIFSMKLAEFYHEIGHNRCYIHQSLIIVSALSGTPRPASF